MMGGGLDGAVAGAERLEAVTRFEEEGERCGGHESDEALETGKKERGLVSLWGEGRRRRQKNAPEAAPRKDEDVLLLQQRAHERDVVRELGEVLLRQAPAHLVHGPLRKERVEARDAREARVELARRVADRRHRVEEEAVRGRGEEGGEGALHGRVGALDAESPFAEAFADLGLGEEGERLGTEGKGKREGGEDVPR